MASTLSIRRLDRVAISLSGLCLVHCVTTTIFVGLLAGAGGVLGSHVIHEVGLSLAVLIGGYALYRGIVDHGFMLPSAIGGLGIGVMAGALNLPHGHGETLFTLVGVALVALGHRLNLIAHD